VAAGLHREIHCVVPRFFEGGAPMHARK
jgi:hypothetical protein